MRKIRPCKVCKFCILLRAKITTIFGPNMVAISARNFTHFSMLFPGIYFFCQYKKLVYNGNCLLAKVKLWANDDMRQATLTQNSVKEYENRQTSFSAGTLSFLASKRSSDSKTKGLGLVVVIVSSGFFTPYIPSHSMRRRSNGFALNL